jgi:hypothetical protein
MSAKDCPVQCDFCTPPPWDAERICGGKRTNANERACDWCYLNLPLEK